MQLRGVASVGVDVVRGGRSGAARAAVRVVGLQAAFFGGEGGAAAGVGGWGAWGRAARGGVGRVDGGEGFVPLGLLSVGVYVEPVEVGG